MRDTGVTPAPYSGTMRRALVLLAISGLLALAGCTTPTVQRPDRPARPARAQWLDPYPSSSSQTLRPERLFRPNPGLEPW